MPKRSDIELIQEYKMTEDNEILMILAQRYRNLINFEVRKVNYICDTNADEEDLRQLALIALHFAIKAYDENGGASFGLFYKVFLKNTLLNRVRRYYSVSRSCTRNAVSIDSDVGHDGDGVLADCIADFKFQPSQRLECKEAASKAAQILMKFNYLERQIFIKKIQGYSYKEIAEMFGIDCKKVDNVIFKIRQQLKKKL